MLCYSWCSEELNSARLLEPGPLCTVLYAEDTIDTSASGKYVLKYVCNSDAPDYPSRQKYVLFKRALAKGTEPLHRYIQTCSGSGITTIVEDYGDS